jgi:hypothetical protein
MGHIGPRPFHRLMDTGSLPQSNKRLTDRRHTDWLSYKRWIKPMADFHPHKSRARTHDLGKGSSGRTAVIERARISARPPARIARADAPAYGDASRLASGPQSATAPRRRAGRGRWAATCARRPDRARGTREPVSRVSPAGPKSTKVPRRRAECGIRKRQRAAPRSRRHARHTTNGSNRAIGALPPRRATG